MGRPDPATGDGDSSPNVVLVAGNTATAAVDGISAAGADADLARHTPAADAELLVYGDVGRAPAVPTSPTGCPTPAVVTRAVHELLGFDLAVVDAGLAADTAAPTVDVGATPGGDVREREPVPEAAAVVDRAREFGRHLPADRVVVGETIPAGTTTAMGVLAALGERETVSSSLPENPLGLKRRVVDEGLAASDLDRGGAAGDPTRALAAMGDPVLAAVAGLVAGATVAGTRVTLAGGTQLLAASALVRHAGVTAPLALATTGYVARDATADLADLAADLSVDVTVTDPGFDGSDRPGLRAFAAGEAKEGVCMGGALALARARGVGTSRVRERVRTVYDRVVDPLDGGG
jgi:uncharacterized protein (TIGR00303 family)